MDYERVLERLLDGFNRLNIRYALMGGFALGALGAPRATQDLDFLVCRDDLPRLHELLTGLSYRRIHHSDNVSQYQGESIVWGFLDFIPDRKARETADIQALCAANPRLDWSRVAQFYDLFGMDADFRELKRQIDA